MSGAESEFLDVGVDEEWANFQGERQGERLVFSCTGFGNPLDCGPFTESDDVRLGRGGSWPRLSRKACGGQGQMSQIVRTDSKAGSEVEQGTGLRWSVRFDNAIASCIGTAGLRLQ